MSLSKKEDTVFKILSIELRKILINSKLDLERINEIRLRIDRPLIVIYEGMEIFFDKNGQVVSNIVSKIGTNIDANIFITSRKMIDETVEFISNYSLYAFENQLKNGYITVAGGHRIGICGEIIMENDKIKSIKYISFLNIRIAHEVIGCADSIITKLIDMDGNFLNTLIISPPGFGKTTLLRDIIRIISNGDDNKGIKSKNVGLVDERSEIAASHLGVPQNNIGIRTDVIYNVPKNLGIDIMVRTMAPKVIAIDEIGNEGDYEAVANGDNCGCRFVATIHGGGIEDLMERKKYRQLLTEKIFNKVIVIKEYHGKRNYEVFDLEKII